MGLLSSIFGGSSSSSSTSTSQQVTNDTQSSDISNVGAADTLISGKQVAYENTFDKNVANSVDNAFTIFGDLADKVLDINKDAIGTVSESGKQALNAVTKAQEASAQPQNSLIKDFIPLLMIATVGAIVFITFKGKK